MVTKPTVTVGNAYKKTDYDALVNFVAMGEIIDGSSGDTTLTASDFGKTVIVNSSSARQVNLPSVDSSHVGGWFVIVKLGSGNVTIDAADSDAINGGAAGGTLVNNVSGETFAYVKLRLVSATAWLIEAGMGTWSTSASMFLLGYPDGPLLKQISTPSTPASGFDRLYAKSDKRVYHLDSDGNENALAHKAASVPRFNTRRWAGWRAAGAMTLKYGITLSETTPSSDVSDDVANWVRIMLYGGTVGEDSNTYASSNSVLARRAHLFDLTIRMKSGVKQDTRLWMGLADANFTDNSDNPASRHLAMFRWSYNVGSGANWYACTKDGTTLNAQDTGVAFSASTAYTLRIWAESGKVCFTINGGSKKELTANLPGSSTGLIPVIAFITNESLAGQDDEYDFGSFDIEWNG
jgi:hypothetical protein